MSQSSDQTGLWQNFIKAITGQVSTTPTNVIGAGSGVTCDLDSLMTGVASAQIYALANTIPSWSLQWNGTTNNDLFTTYQQFVNIIHPNALDPDSSEGKATWNTMEEIQDKIVSFQNKVDTLKKEMYLAWLNLVCLDIDTSKPDAPKCNTKGYYPSDIYPEGDKPYPSFTKWLQDNKDVGEWAEKIQILTQNGAETLIGLQSEYAALAQKYFGAGYQTINEAQQLIAWADPLGIAISKNPPPDDVKKQIQMQIKEGGNVVTVPNFYASPDLEDYRTWVKEQQDRSLKNGGPLFGDKADVQSVFDDTTSTHTESGWKFSVNLGIPIDWFWLGGSAEGSHQEQYDEKTTFKGTITYQSVTKVMLNPGNWFMQSLLNTYANFDLSTLKSGDPFYQKQLWGPNGVFNVIIKGVIVGYAPYLRIEMQDWQNSQSKTNWSTKATYGIGPFNFESASASGFNYSAYTEEINNGIEVKDTSGQPKIIALIVETPNYNMPS